MEPIAGFEPAASALPRKCSTPELYGLKDGNLKIQRILKDSLKDWSGRRVSNPQPSAWKADALPIELHPLYETKEKWWGGADSNCRSQLTADLQSAPFSHSGTSPKSGAG
jgi:hypothetical protein